MSCDAWLSLECCPIAGRSFEVADRVNAGHAIADSCLCRKEARKEGFISLIGQCGTATKDEKKNYEVLHRDERDVSSALSSAKSSSESTDIRMNPGRRWLPILARSAYVG